MKRNWILAVAVSWAAAFAPAAFGAPDTPPKLRLPKTPRPLRYAVDLTVVPEKETFSGAVDIEIQLDRPARVIWVNATELAISEASLEAKGRRVPARIFPGGEDFVGFSFERVGVLEDVATLAAAGQLPLPEALAIVPDFAGDANLHIVSTMVRIAEGIDEHLVAEERRADYERFVRETFGARARALGWNPKPGEDEETQLLRPKLLRLVAQAGRDPEVRREARRLALAWLDDPKATGPDTLGSVLGVTAEEGDRALFERFRDQLKKTRERRDRRSLFGALGRFLDPAIRKDALVLVLSAEFDIRESIWILYAALADRRTQDAAWEFFKANFDALVEKIPQETGGQLPRFGRSFCDAAHRRDVESFFAGRVEKLTGAPRVLAETVESIDQCLALANDQSAAVGEFLAKY